MAVHPGGAQTQGSGQVGATVLYAPDGTALKTTVDSGAGKALAVQLWDSVLNDYVHIDGAGRLYTTVSPGNAANNPLYIQGALQPSIPVAQTVLHGVNSIVLPAAGPGLRNIVTSFQVLVHGTGTAPSQASPVSCQVLDGATVKIAFNVAGFSNTPIWAPAGGVAGTANTSMTITVSDAGLNNSTDINLAYQVG